MICSKYFTRCGTSTIEGKLEKRNQTKKQQGKVYVIILHITLDFLQSHYSKSFYMSFFRSTHLQNIAWSGSDKLSGIAVNVKFTDYNVINEHLRNINQFTNDRYEERCGIKLYLLIYKQSMVSNRKLSTWNQIIYNTLASVESPKGWAK